jgi:NSS family neurotransmitter:Na+ symporter
LVVGWIGVQYTAFSLANLCSNGNAIPAESDEEAVEAEKAAPAAEQKLPAKERYDGKSGEKTKTGPYPLP